MKTLISILAIFAISIPQIKAQTPAPREATSAEVTAGTAGWPAVITPRRLGSVSSGGGGGVVSNVTGLTFVLATSYTNTTAYWADVQAHVTSSLPTGSTRNAGMNFEVSPTANNSYTVRAKWAQGTDGGTQLGAEDYFGGMVPPGGAWKFTDASSLGGSVAFSASHGAIYYTTTNGASGGSSGGVSAAEVAAIMATNGQPVDLQKQWPLPLIAFDTWATWQASVHELYSTNVAAWATNLANTLYTNGLAKSVGTVIWIDDGWVVTNRVNNRIMWNTNMFPMGMTNLAKMVHAKNSKLFLYSSRATNTCAGLVGSPTNYVYQDIQDMMSWGIDGCFFDTCNNTVEQDAQYSTVWTKLAQQSISDFQIATYATQGVVMPFYLNTTTGNGAESPGQQHAVAQFFNVVNALGWNWTDQASTLTSYVAQAKETLKFLGPYIRPGFYPDALRVYAPNMVDNTYFLPAMIPLAMTCQQLRIGAGDRSNPDWPVTNHTAATYDAGYPYWQMTNSILPMLGNTKLMEVWLDPLVSPATIVWTNQATELWVKRLVDQNRKAVSLMNLAATNCTVSINIKDFGGASNVAYTVWNVLSNSMETVFANQFSYTLAPTNAVLFTIEPADSSQKVFSSVVSDTRWEAVSWKEMNFTGTGLSQQTVAATMGSPFAPLSEGMYQSAANNFWQHGVPLPAWATNVTLAYCVYSDFAGTVAWTNAVRVYSYQLTGAQTTLADTNWPVVTTSGTATWITNIATFATTNIPREIVVTFGGSSNSSPRRVIGPMYRRFY